jgi:4-amino-4-deoxy-L-arabinose transferase-like glycosyltransferase
MVVGHAEKAGGEAAALPWIVLLIVTVSCLIPFSGKAFHIDDTLFIQAARHIQSHAGNPYGFSVNWYGAIMPISEVMKNPPLNSYFIALTVRLAGWSETVLHLAFLIPAFAVILGTYRLAGFFCKNSLFAALLTLLTPSFLVSATTVMCDVPMLAFWIWATVFWVRGIEKNDFPRLAVSGILIALSALTKYYGMSLIPLLLIYTAARKRGLGWWTAYLLIPIAVLGWYQYATHALYGRGLLLDAAEYASGARERLGATLLPKTLVGLAFVGGSFLAVPAYAFWTRSKKWLAFGALSIGILMLILSSMGQIGGFPLANEAGEVKWLLILQLGIFITLGIGLTALAAAEIYARRDANSILLVAWIAGTLLFSAYINWTVNVRSILPLVPAASILLVRRIEDADQSPKKMQARPKSKKKFPPVRTKPLLAGWTRLIGTLIPVACIALLAAHADLRLANSARTAAAEIRKQYSRDRILFEGHWGFQHYMELWGGKPVDFQAAADAVPGDVLVIPANNTNTQPVPEGIASPLPDLTVNAGRLLATMNPAVGAGFYADVWGPLPFAFGDVPPERYMVYRIHSKS